MDEPTRATSVKHLKLVQRETERCTAIVRNLLDFARQRPLVAQGHRRRARCSRKPSRWSATRPRSGPHDREDGRRRCRSSRPTSASCARPFVNIILNGCEAMQSGGVAHGALRARRRREARSSSPARTPAWASRRTGWRRSSTRSSPPRRRAPGSACRWSTASSSATAAPSTSAARSARAPPSSLRLPVAAQGRGLRARGADDGRGRAHLVDWRRRGRRPPAGRRFASARRRAFRIQARLVPPRGPAARTPSTRAGASTRRRRF